LFPVALTNSQNGQKFNWPQSASYLTIDRSYRIYRNFCTILQAVN